jgi:hypothetical protein
VGRFKRYFELSVWLNFGGVGQFIGAGGGIEAGNAGIPPLGSGEALDGGFKLPLAGLGFAVGDEVGGRC